MWSTSSCHPMRTPEKSHDGENWNCFGNFSSFFLFWNCFWQFLRLFIFFKIVLANFRPLPFLAATLIWALSAHRLFCESRHFAKYFHQHFELHWHLSKRGKACKYFFLVFFHFFLTYRFWVRKSRKKYF